MTGSIKLRLNNFGRLTYPILESLMGLFVVNYMWGCSDSILRTNNYDPSTEQFTI